jgi:hypothetical protein
MSPNERRPGARRGVVPLHDALPGGDDDLAEQDEDEQAEPLSEVMRVDRLRRVAGPQRVEVLGAPGAAQRLAVLGEQRARLQGDRDAPRDVAPRLGEPDRGGQERRRRQVRAADPLPQQALAPGVGDRQHQARDRQAAGEHGAVARGGGLDGDGGTPAGTQPASTSSRCGRS